MHWSVQNTDAVAIGGGGALSVAYVYWLSYIIIYSVGIQTA